MYSWCFLISTLELLLSAPFSCSKFKFFHAWLTLNFRSIFTPATMTTTTGKKQIAKLMNFNFPKQIDTLFYCRLLFGASLFIFHSLPWARLCTAWVEVSPCSIFHRSHAKRRMASVASSFSLVLSILHVSLVHHRFNFKQYQLAALKLMNAKNKTVDKLLWRKKKGFYRKLGNFSAQ